MDRQSFAGVDRLKFLSWMDSIFMACSAQWLEVIQQLQATQVGQRGPSRAVGHPVFGQQAAGGLGLRSSETTLVSSRYMGPRAPG